MSILNASLIERVLMTRRLGRPVLYFPTVGSTNDVAHAEAAEGAPDGLLVVADEQTAGRGRLDRRWWAPSGTCLLFSLLLRPDIPPAQAGRLTMCLGLGAAEGIQQVTGLQPMLKWPNDLVLNGRKLGGMLSELRVEGEKLRYAVLGIGINVNLDLKPPSLMADQAEDTFVLPAELFDTAISLMMALGRPVDRRALLAHILAATEVWYERVRRGESPYAAWAARLETLGQRVRVSLRSGVLEGNAVAVTPDGALIVRDETGREHVIWSGDVTTLRPAF
ncbi:MAG: biotin--[acetyl-CoA-carboxylase] ligase [Anaerolineae bacterium]|nr:biotin--[acetyl-CoA-carboxylase] ligase [Anaerolineae bacterium]